jgi:hypothetical protein
MLRIALAVLACLLLGACSGWVSDERLFGEGDWAHLAINGRCRNMLDSESKDRIILRSRPDGLIEGRNTDRHDKSRMLIGLVAIKGGSLMSAGLEAEKFVSANHIVQLTPSFGLEPDDDDEERSGKRR